MHTNNGEPSDKAKNAPSHGEGLDFAPNNASDHRKIGEWESRYPRTAQIQILVETLIILAIFLLIPAFLAAVAFSEKIPYVSLTPHQLTTLKQCAFAFSGGLLGGILFDMKWLYHSVAHGIWNQDRFLWRLLTPFISAGLAFSFFIMIRSNIFKIFDPTSISTPSSIIAVSFLVGYFSDSALAKMYELATTLFGVAPKSSDKDKKKPKADPPSDAHNHQ